MSIKPSLTSRSAPAQRCRITCGRAGNALPSGSPVYNGIIYSFAIMYQVLANLVYVARCIVIQPSASAGCGPSARAHSSCLNEQVVCSDDVRIHQRRSVPRQPL